MCPAHPPPSPGMDIQMAHSRAFQPPVLIPAAVSLPLDPGDLTVRPEVPPSLASVLPHTKHSYFGGGCSVVI